MRALIRSWMLAAIAGAALASLSPVFGQETTDMLGKALDLVRQVENPTGNPPTDAQRIDLLTQAITAAQEAPNHRLKGHRVLAIQAIRSAIAEIRNGDPNHEAAVYLQTAETELSTSITLAKADEPATQPSVEAASPAPAPSSSSPSATIPSPGDDIFRAARRGDLAKVEALVQADPSLVFRKDGFGVTPLSLAVDAQHDDVVAFLLAHNADVNVVDFLGETALHKAAINGDKPFAELLIANKADVNARDRNGLTPLYDTALMGRTEVAELLLDHGADVNAAGKEGTFWAGDTPLYMAACNGNSGVVEVLLAHHADLNAKGKDGLTALEIAVKNHHNDVAEMLRDPARALAAEAPPPAPADGVPPEAVIAKLVADASEKPPGPVENEVTAEMVGACEGLLKMVGDKRSPQEAIAETYNTFALEGPLTVLYAKGTGAILYGKAKLTAAAWKNFKENPDVSSEETTVNGKAVWKVTGPSVGFGAGENDFLDVKVPDDGQVIASFCLVQEHGVWRVHCMYFSDEPLQGDNKDFIERALAEFARKS